LLLCEPVAFPGDGRPALRLPEHDEEDEPRELDEAAAKSKNQVTLGGLSRFAAPHPLQPVRPVPPLPRARRLMAQPSFFALRQPVFRAYFFGAASAMMADSIEHVISYWIMFEKFHSPALAGFAVISHWVPFILFSLWSGALADRYDPRRIIQAGMLVFMAVSLGWGLLFVTDALEMWHAAL